MIEIPFYSILDRPRWERVTAEVHTLLRRSGTGRNAPCPCGSGKKHKTCCGLTISAPPEHWLDEFGQLRAFIAEGLNPELRRDVLHIARMERAYRRLNTVGLLPEDGRMATEQAALAGMLRREGKTAEQMEALRLALKQPQDLCLDYRRVVYDLVSLARQQGKLELAIEAQRWWIDFLEDFGKQFGLRVEAVDELHALLVEAGHAPATEESRQALHQSLFGPPPEDRTALYAKLQKDAARDSQDV